MNAWKAVSLILGVLWVAVPAGAQDQEARQGAAVPAAAAPAAALPSWDLAGSLGWRQARVDRTASGEGTWYHDSASFGAEVGYYWTEHLRTEAGVATGPEDELFAGSGETIVVAGRRYWLSSVDYVRAERFFVNQLYQFGRNAWVHPFVGAGMHVLRETRHGIQYLYPVDGPTRQETLPRRTDTRLAGAALAGLKIYFSRRGFVRTDGVVTFGKTLDQLVLRVGAGMDF